MMPRRDSALFRSTAVDLAVLEAASSTTNRKSSLESVFTRSTSFMSSVAKKIWRHFSWLSCVVAEGGMTFPCGEDDDDNDDDDDDDDDEDDDDDDDNDSTASE